MCSFCSDASEETIGTYVGVLRRLRDHSQCRHADNACTTAIPLRIVSALCFRRSFLEPDLVKVEVEPRRIIVA